MMNTKIEQCSVYTSDHVKVAFDHYQREHSSVIIIAHGFYNSKDALLLKDLAQDLSSTYDVIVLDFRGHGQSKGLFYWTSKERLDLEAVLEFAKTRYSRIGIIGFSLGAAISIITASKSDLIHSIVAVSAPTEFEKIEYRLWELNLENDIWYSLLRSGRVGKGVRPGPFWLAKEKPINLVEQLKQPILYIHGTKDWIIKPWHSKKLFEKTSSPKQLEIIQNGPHAEYLLRRHSSQILDPIKDWFAKTL